jgi:hemerythrin-like domain-containing protein
VSGSHLLTRPLARARREHQALLGRLSRFERTWSRPATSARLRQRRAALPRLIDACDSGIAPHLANEETVLYPTLHAHLPEDTGTLDAALREHDTLREVMSLLRQRGERYIGGETAAEVEIAATLQDLIELWRQHVRRIDNVIAPLIARWPEAHHG